MKRFLSMALSALFAQMLISCAASTPVPPTAIRTPPPPTATPTRVLPAAADMLEPGDQIGEMLLTTISEHDSDIDLMHYCDTDHPKELAEGVYEIECQATPGDRVFFGNCAGVAGDTAAELDSAWANLKAEVAFDGQVLNLPSFGPIEFTAEGSNIRVWNLMIENITPGIHTVHSIVAAEDYAWDSTFRFTVADHEEAYPLLSSPLNPGQHPCKSEQAQMSFLLCLPDDYGQDPQQTWPLVLFLHGMDTRGSDLFLLKREPLVQRLEADSDFPSIVVSPQRSGESGYEFRS